MPSFLPFRLRSLTLPALVTVAIGLLSTPDASGDEQEVARRCCEQKKGDWYPGTFTRKACDAKPNGAWEGTPGAQACVKSGSGGAGGRSGQGGRAGGGGKKHGKDDK